MSGRGAALLALVTLAYPFAVFLAIRRDQTLALWVMAAVGVTLVVARLLTRPSAAPSGTVAPPPPLGLAVAAPAVLVALALLGRWANWPRLALAWPVMVNLGFLWSFGISLRANAMPVVERLARLQDPELTPEKVRYCRTVNQIWCSFFLFNIVVMTSLAQLPDLRWWTLFTGVISYTMMGLIFAVELVVRWARFGWDVSLPHRIGLRIVTFCRRAFAR